MDAQIKRWSFSGLSIFEQCPFRAKLRYIDRIPEPEFSRGAAAARGTRVHEDAERFIKGEIKLTEELKRFEPEFLRLKEYHSARQIETEAAFAFTRSWERTAHRSNDQWVEMVIDSHVVLDARTRLVVDFKTGKREGNEVKHAEQGQLYMVGAFMADPLVQKVIVEFWYLDKDDLSFAEYNRDNMEVYKASFDKRGSAMTSASFFPPEPSKSNCRWCPYRSSRTGGTGHCEFSKE